MVIIVENTHHEKCSVCRTELKKIKELGSPVAVRLGLCEKCGGWIPIMENGAPKLGPTWFDYFVAISEERG